MGGAAWKRDLKSAVHDFGLPARVLGKLRSAARIRPARHPPNDTAHQLRAKGPLLRILRSAGRQRRTAPGRGPGRSAPVSCMRGLGGVSEGLLWLVCPHPADIVADLLHKADLRLGLARDGIDKSIPHRPAGGRRGGVHNRLAQRLAIGILEERVG